MYQETVSIFAGVVALLVAAIVWLYRRHRRIVAEKNRGIIRHIQRQDCLQHELDRVQIEKATLEKCMDRYAATVPATPHAAQRLPHGTRQAAHAGTEISTCEKKNAHMREKNFSHVSDKLPACEKNTSPAGASPTADREAGSRKQEAGRQDRPCRDVACDVCTERLCGGGWRRATQNSYK
jgi:hypothetical protein